MDMKSIMRKVMMLLLAFIMVICSYTVSFADDLDDNQEKQDQVKSQIQQIEEDAIAQKAVVDDLAAKVSDLQSQIAGLEYDIAQKEADIQETKLAISDRENGLGQRLRVMYKNGSIGFLDVILKSNDISEFLSNIAMVQAIYRHDANTLDELKEQNKRLAAEEADLRDAMSVLEYNKAQLETEKAEAATQEAAFQQKMSELKEELEKLEAEEEEIKKKAQALANAGYSGPVYSGGALQWPCTGYTITDYFGMRIHPILGYSRGHTGMDISCSWGSPIFAAEDGVVIYSGWYGTFGYAVMIQHSASMVTMYAHNSQLLVGVGETVSRGETIALCGSTGWSTGPHCHFEVQINGTPVDPAGYLY